MQIGTRLFLFTVCLLSAFVATGFAATNTINVVNLEKNQSCADLHSCLLLYDRHPISPSTLRTLTWPLAQGKRRQPYQADALQPHRCVLLQNRAGHSSHCTRHEMRIYSQENCD